MDYIISGIQQVGIGVRDVHEAFKWYNRSLGIDVPVFEEDAEAALMLPYTGGEPHKRHAILAISLRGGGGFEIWQYKSRKPQPPPFNPQLGDLGLFCAKIKSSDPDETLRGLKAAKADVFSDMASEPGGRKHFFFRDPFGNLFQVHGDTGFFSKGGKANGGPDGMIIGVSDVTRSKAFYTGVLGYDKVLFEGEGVFEDLAWLPGGGRRIKRVILTHSEPRKGPFSKLLGQSCIELVQSLDEPGRKITAGRLWGDLGFIHLCFDVRNMQALKKKCESAGHPFTVDGGAGFEMGEAAGHFTYIEDPDGALIEFVETKKIPILKKFGWYLDLTKRNPETPLPDWMLKALRFNRRKF